MVLGPKSHDNFIHQIEMLWPSCLDVRGLNVRLWYLKTDHSRATR